MEEYENGKVKARSSFLYQFELQRYLVEKCSRCYNSSKCRAIENSNIFLRVSVAVYDSQF